MSKSNRSNHVIAGAFGNILEWYDFAVFGFLAPAMANQFFPAHDSLAGLIRVYGVFAAGYLMRPLGGMIFGHIGDRMGRKRALELSILMMALPTVLVGLLPTHAQIGSWAALLLVLLRLIQGVSIGGELIGSISYLVEMAPAKKRGLHGSWTLFTATGGLLLGSLLVTALRDTLGAQAVADWGWRIPFLLGIVIAGAGLWLRMGLPESDVFEARAEPEAGPEAGPSPVVLALREAGGPILHLCALLLLFAGGFYILFVWMPTYLSDILDPPVPHSYAVNSIAMVALLALIPVAGSLSDRLGRRRVLLTGMVLMAVLAYPLFLVIDTGVAAYVLGAQVVFAVVIALNQGPIPALMAEMFPTRIRSSAIGIAYNVTLGIVGGTAPLASTWLIAQTGDLAAPAYYLTGLATVSTVALLGLKLKQGEPLA